MNPILTTLSLEKWSFANNAMNVRLQSSFSYYAKPVLILLYTNRFELRHYQTLSRKLALKLKLDACEGILVTVCCGQNSFSPFNLTRMICLNLFLNIPNICVLTIDEMRENVSSGGESDSLSRPGWSAGWSERENLVNVNPIWLPQLFLPLTSRITGRPC